MHILESMNRSFNTTAHFDKLAEVATGRLTVEQLSSSLDGLRANSRQLAYIVSDAIQNNDFIMIVIDNCC